MPVSSSSLLPAHCIFAISLAPAFVEGIILPGVGSVHIEMYMMLLINTIKTHVLKRHWNLSSNFDH